MDGLSTLQRHVLFFDRDKDGFISLRDTFRGMRAIGCGVLLSALSALVLNYAFSWATRPWWVPTLSVDIRHIAKGVYGSDTGSFRRTSGNLNEERFNAMFDAYDEDGDGFWSFDDLLRCVRREAAFLDFFGLFLSLFKMSLTFWVAADHRGLSKASLRGAMDGTLFYTLERLHQDAQSMAKGAAAHDARRTQRGAAVDVSGQVPPSQRSL